VTVKRLTPSDAMFLYAESRETMMHVAGMMPFSPPRDAPRDYMRALMDEIRAGIAVHRPWNLRLHTPEFLRNPLQTWIEDTEVDLEYHVRRSALPSPGDERELGILVSRLHGHPIDFHRPPWEMHLIEGLEGGRFAMYVKMHHSFVDGFTAMRMLANAMSPDPDERERPLFFSIPPPERRARRDPGAPAPAADGDGRAEPAGLPELMALVREQYGVTKTAVRALMKVMGGEDDLITPRQAPMSVLNGRIGRNRRFATAQLDLARVKAVAKAAGGTLNDAILALCSASLRRYLGERDALPTTPLVAMVPVSIRPKDDAGGGNAIGAVLASLATTIEDPAQRLAAIVASTTTAKQQLQGMSPAAILQYSALLIAPMMLQMIPGAAGRLRPTFNIVISNVPGPEHPLYFRGARLEASYPMSIPIHGQALNITCSSYAGRLCFGFTGCRDTLPHLQRLAVYCAEALGELEHAIGGAPA
jgi:diacylglycerol O-acyltransferase / wax synthase